MLSPKLKTPVAFIIFNRPDATERVFAEIVKAKPPKLLVIGDGARASRPGEAEKIAAARTIIQRVDWECEVLTNFSEVNLGCKRRVSSGIDWVFEQVEEAIILEDDCLPDPSFFRFCQELLERYRHDQRIGMISGDNFQFGRRYGDDSYYFSKYVHIWGWATWRDRWVESYDVAIDKWPTIRDEGRLVDMVGDAREARYWGKIFERVHRGLIDTWDYQWVFANWVEGRISIMPSRNLISNIGFGVSATHTTGASDVADLSVFTLKFPLTHPLGIFRNIRADRINYDICFRVPFWKRVYGKIVGILRVKFNWFK
jgi:hypothetical protein